MSDKPQYVPPQVTAICLCDHPVAALECRLVQSRPPGSHRTVQPCLEVKCRECMRAVLVSCQAVLEAAVSHNMSRAMELVSRKASATGAPTKLVHLSG